MTLKLAVAYKMNVTREAGRIIRSLWQYFEYERVKKLNQCHFSGNGKEHINR